MFGALAERAGRDGGTLELRDGVTASELLDEVARLHPDAAGIVHRIQVAVNLELVPAEHRIEADDEVALLPPVAGGQASVHVGLRKQPSVDEALDAVAHRDAGGTAVFLGTVRADQGRVERLEYSPYAEMAEKVLRDVAEEAVAKWSLFGVAVLHGTGDLKVGDRTVVVACSAAHRGEAFDACRHVIDEVKRRAPIWKKEVGPEGGRWVGLE